MPLKPARPPEYRRRRIAVVLSVTVHGIGLWLIAEAAWWRAPAAESPLVASVVFVTPPEPPANPTIPVDESVPAAELPQPLPEPRETAESADVVDDDVPVEAAPTAARDETASASAQPTAVDDPAEPPALPPIDWDEAGRKAIKAWLDRQPGAETMFSGDDLSGRAPPGQGLSVKSPFESNAPRRVALQPNRSRSAIVRRIGALCEGLTGGVSLFGLVALCTDREGRRDLFADIRPDYLDELPECEQVTLSPEAQAMAIEAGLSTTPIKCRMVDRDARYRDSPVQPSYRD